MNTTSPTAVTGLIPPKAQKQVPPVTPPARWTGEVNILLVDDRRDKLTALEALLSGLGQNLVLASSGQEALRHLLKDEFAVILMDVNMPGLDGFETASLIRQRKSTEHTPIIFISSINTHETHIFKGYSLKAVDYIFAPIIPEILKTKVEVFIELHRKTQEIKEQAEQLLQLAECENFRRLTEAREKLELETSRNRFFILATDMLGVASFEADLQQINPAWEKVLGHTEEKLKGSNIFEHVHPGDRPDLVASFSNLKAGAASANFENRMLCHDGTTRWISWTMVPFVAEQLVYIFGRDITPRKKVEQALQETNTELESFSYTVSHDLRAPLRAMQGFADALLEDYAPSLDPTGQDYARRIVTAARRMDTLIQDLLVYSRLNRNELLLEPLQLDVILNDASIQLENEIRTKNARVEIIHPLTAACGHQGTLVQVCTNLISNALKFVPSGVVPHVRIWAEKSGNKCKLFFKDNGIGIAPEYHQRIFRVFERLHGVETYPGTGIGLAIVRKGMERMNGTVGLNSEPDQGSTFWLELSAPE